MPPKKSVVYYWSFNWLSMDTIIVINIPIMFVSCAGVYMCACMYLRAHLYECMCVYLRVCVCLHGVHISGPCVTLLALCLFSTSEMDGPPGSNNPAALNEHRQGDLGLFL